jgi:uncharacterized protein YjlB
VQSDGNPIALSASTGHCRISASDDLLVAGSYPAKQS